MQAGFNEQCTRNLHFLPDAYTHSFMLQFKRGKAATGKASCFSRYLSPSSAEGVQHSTLFEQLSLSLFYLFGSGLSGLGVYTSEL